MRVFLINPMAGQTWHRWRRRALLRSISQSVDACVIETTRETVAQTRALLRDRPTAVIACGGDGTVAAVAEALAGTEVPLGIVPCGTTNVLAREFGIPRDPIRAAVMMQRLTTYRPLQTWLTDRGSLVLGAGVGWDGRLMHSVPSLRKRRFGFAALLPTALRLLMSYDFPQLRIVAIGSTGDRETVIATSVLISNSRYWAGPNPAITDANPSDELLDVVVLDQASMSHHASFWLRLALPGGAPLRLAGVRRLRLRELTVASEPSQAVEVHLNGEARGYTPISFVLGPVVHVLTPVV